MSWVAWLTACKPISKGGLGIRSLRKINRAMLAKWHARYCNEPNAWWRKLMSEKMRTVEEFLLPCLTNQAIGRSMWFEILRANKDFFTAGAVRVKSGSSLRFWHDWWIEDKSLKEKYPRLYKLSRQKDASVAGMKNNTWNFLFSRDLNPAKRIDFLEIKRDIRNVNLVVEGEEDVCEGDFSAKALYTKLMNPEPDWEYGRIIKNNRVPPKVLFLIWTALHDSVPTRSMLQYRGMQIISTSCVFCDEEEETASHLFIHCSMAGAVWSKFLGSLQIPWVLSNDIKNMFLIWWIRDVSNWKKIVWQLFPFAIILVLWLKRNSIVHGGRSKSKDELVKAVILNICLWSVDTKIFSDFTMDQIIHNWENVICM